VKLVGVLLKLCSLININTGIYIYICYNLAELAKEHMIILYICVVQFVMKENGKDMNAHYP